MRCKKRTRCKTGALAVRVHLTAAQVERMNDAIGG